jgi:energy-coupling factor transport system substrate-specific component
VNARVSAIPMRRRSTAVLAVVSAIGLAAFGWPLLMTPAAGVEHGADAPWLFAVILPLLIAVVASELADGGMDAKAVAMLGVLAAVGAALRPLGGGATGFQPMFVVIVIGGYVFGPGFGFTLGATSMFGSALLTGGVGPWLPFQMLAAAWVGLGAGLLPRLSGRRELVVVGLYGAAASMAFGLVMNLSFWPWATSTASSLGYVAGAAAAENLGRFVAFHLATSLGWDLTRAIGTLVLVLALGRPAIAALRRAARRAAFTAPRSFVAHDSATPTPEPVP